MPKIQGNAVNSSQNYSIRVSEARKNLETAISNKDFFVAVEVDGKVQKLAVTEGSLRETFSYSEPEDQSSSNVGAIVGIPMATFVTGIFVGGVVMAVLVKKFNMNIPYLVQE